MAYGDPYYRTKRRKLKSFKAPGVVYSRAPRWTEVEPGTWEAPSPYMEEEGGPPMMLRIQLTQHQYILRHTQELMSDGDERRTFRTLNDAMNYCDGEYAVMLNDAEREMREARG